MYTTFLLKVSPDSSWLWFLDSYMYLYLSWSPFFEKWKNYAISPAIWNDSDCKYNIKKFCVDIDHDIICWFNLFT